MVMEHEEIQEVQKLREKEKVTEDYVLDRAEKVLRINLMNYVYGASVEDFPPVMGKVIDILRSVKDARSIVLIQDREYEYDLYQTNLLREIADVLEFIRREKIISIRNIASPGCEQHIPGRTDFLNTLLVDKIRTDPIGAYVLLKRKIEEMKVLENEAFGREKVCFRIFITKALNPIKDALERTELIRKVKDAIPGHHIGSREIYREIFHPTIKPNFMLTRYQASIPENGIEIDHYTIPVVNAEVRIFKVPGDVRMRYFVYLPEFDLNEEEYAILDTAKRYMAEHEPTEAEFAEPERTREIFYNIGRDMILDIAANSGIELKEETANKLALILTRYTAGLGILEILLADENLQDIYLNSPPGATPMFVLHGKYGECEANLMPTKEDAESWATRFRMISGRPLDEANPVLDTEAEVPGGRARVAAITRTLSPDGLGFAFRRHRGKPWTFPLFMEVRYMNSLAAGLMSFLIDGARTMLIAGTRSSGKSSLLGACMLELMKRYRIVTVEDSVTGNCEILCKVNNEFRKIEVGKLVDSMFEKYHYSVKNGREILKNFHEKIEVFCMDKSGKLNLSPVSSLIRHKVNKKIYEVETRTGRKIEVTEDHSLFTLKDSGEIGEVRTRDLRIGDYIATPRILKAEKKDLEYLDLTKYAEKLNGYFVSEEIPFLIKKRKEMEKAKKLGYSESDLELWIKNKIVPAKVFYKLEFGEKVNKDCLFYKVRENSEKIKCKIALDERFLIFLGMWLVDGRHDIIVRHKGKNIDTLGDLGPLKHVLENLGFDENSHMRRIPEFVYNLSERQMCLFLKGVFIGRGYATKYEAGIDIMNRKLLEDLQTLLLWAGIISKITSCRTSGKIWSLRITGKFLKPFRDKIGFLQEYKNKALENCRKKAACEVLDIVPLSLDFKRELSLYLKGNYLPKDYGIEREDLKIIAKEIPAGDTELSTKTRDLAFSDIFWDEIKSIREIKHNGIYVYDFSVPEYENFVCENVLAHNTLELNVPKMRELGYNIERMKSRSVITQVESELSADEAIRTALRLGDSVLIIGEVRSLEAKALYEAMRIGALANFVGGTIHGDSAYGVFDRVVNDLGVPPTSFKATDIVVIANTLKSPDGLHTFRRITSIVEVRKDWSKDPIKEKAFTELMVYDAEKDELVPTDTLLNGESFILNAIANNVREWKNNWEAVWDNILLRAKIKEALLQYSRKLNDRSILEADFVVKANDIFHEISEKVKSEYKTLNSDRIFGLWNLWVKKELRTRGHEI